jgi:hypothetical protein
MCENPLPWPNSEHPRLDATTRSGLPPTGSFAFQNGSGAVLTHAKIQLTVS